MPPKGYKMKQKASHLADINENKKLISNSQYTIDGQNKIIDNLEHIKHEKLLKNDIDKLNSIDRQYVF